MTSIDHKMYGLSHFGVPADSVVLEKTRVLEGFAGWKGLRTLLTLVAVSKDMGRLCSGPPIIYIYIYIDVCG